MKYQPDFDNFRKALLRDGEPEKIPSWELFADTEIVQDILGKKMGSPFLEEVTVDYYLDCMLEFQIKMGYDYLPVPGHLPLPKTNYLRNNDTAQLTKGQRSWLDEHTGMIVNWEDFEKYPWPKLESLDYNLLENAVKKLPDGMKVMFWTSGILENVEWLMGYEPMSFATVDNPELIDALFEKIGELISTMYKNASQIKGVGLFSMGDDMGFKGGTLFAPDFLRKYVFPWQKKCVDTGHNNDIPFILHSCGNLDIIMDDIIDYVGVDGKHSFEDNILRVEEAKRLYGERIAIVGGIDIDFLCRSTEEEVRKRVRRTLEKCAPGGGYIMGTGNSVANYIPVKNYLAMMDETKKFNAKHR